MPTFQNAPHFRVWHNACSSGEEVYSLLILAIELGFEKSVEIIASDVNTSRLKVAESGIFQLKFMKKYEAYYQQIGGKKSLFHYGEILGDHYFQFHESIRNKIKFSYLDCIQQPGFVQCDLVFTRNVLMYFTMELQQKVLFKLTECVKPNGYIFFGNNEDMSWVPDFSKYFRVSDKSSYQKI